MAPDIPHLIAAMNPDVFCAPKARKLVRTQLRSALSRGDRLAYLKAAKVAQPRESNEIVLERLEETSPFDMAGQRSPIEEHTLILDNAEEPLEPVYFNLLDELQARDAWVVEKLVDTVSTTPGSGLSADLTRRVTQQQQEVSKLLVQVHKQVRELINHWQRWREKKRQLSVYEQARALDDSTRDTAVQQLRYRWRRENDDAVATAKPSDGDNAAFDSWLTSTGAELRKQLEVDRRLLASELNLLKLQTNWVRPFLEQHQDTRRPGNPALVTVFNTAVFEVVLLVTPPSDLELAVQAGDLPKLVLSPRYRRCWPMLTVYLRFRAIPERSNKGAYGHRGKAEINFSSFALNEEEFSIFRRELQRSEWGEVLGLLEQNAAADLGALLNDLDELLAEEAPASSQPTPVSEDTNPFSALLSCVELFTSLPAKTEPPAPVEPLRPDNEIERVLRSFALLEARKWCRELYEQQKRQRQMPIWGD